MKAIAVFCLCAVGLCACDPTTRPVPEKVYCQGELCADDQGCMAPTCDQQTGACAYQADNSRCFAGERCDATSGECIPAGCKEDAHCADTVDCTEDKCIDKEGQDEKVCRHVRRNDLCDDGVDCTENICSIEAGGCRFEARHERCSPGQRCDPEAGCQDITCQIGEDCDDGNACTLDSCDAGRCSWSYVECPLPDDPCKESLCDPASGVCSEEPGNEGAPCELNNRCFMDATCQSGVCQGIPVACQETPCYQASCDASLGCVYTPVSDKDCDDENDCTVNDRCVNGSCIGDPLDADADGYIHQDCPGGDDCNDQDPTIRPGVPDICDGLDNNCDTQIDETSGTSAETETICACLTPCGADASTCASDEQCTHIAGTATVCLHPCTVFEACPASTDGRERVCALLDTGGYSGHACVCRPGCPEQCSTALDCYPYGLTACTGGVCESICTVNAQCPEPYMCRMERCVCDPAPDGCLTCVEPADCDPPADCKPRPNSPGSDLMECEYPCDMTQECIDLTQKNTYCHYDPMGTVPRCACAPKSACAPCDTAGMDTCLPAFMACMTFSDFNTTIEACTTGCEDDRHCPVGWFCRDGHCVEMGCHCEERDCQIDQDCLGLSPDFTCMMGMAGGLCTKECAENQECPLGYHCYTDEFNGTQYCRCPPP
jgi:hypothetical protein